MHGRLIEDIARAIDFGRVWIHLILDLSFRDIGEDGSGVLVRSRKRRAGGEGNRTQLPLTIGDFRPGSSRSALDSAGFALPVSPTSKTTIFAGSVPLRFRSSRWTCRVGSWKTSPGVVELRRIGIDLVLDVSFEDVGEDWSFMVRPGSRASPYIEDEHTHLRIDCVAQRLLQQGFRCYGRRFASRSLPRKKRRARGFSKTWWSQDGEECPGSQSVRCTVPWIPCNAPAILESPPVVSRDIRG